MKAFFVAVLMTGIGLGVNSNSLATTREGPFPASGSCSFGALGYFLVEGFFGGIVPTIKTTFKHAYRAMLGCEHKNEA